MKNNPLKRAGMRLSLLEHADGEKRDSLVAIMMEPAGKKDMTEIAAVFSQSFGDSVRFFAGQDTLPEAVLADIFGLIRKGEPQALLVARQIENRRVVGYIVVTRNVRRIWHKVLLKGWWLRLAGRWALGGYGLGCSPVLKSLYNKLFFLRSEKSHGKKGQARILSLAVAPSLQGQGIGSQLLKEGLAYLNAEGVSSVRLEVRPENLTARHLYAAQGFQESGSFTDLQGEWLILEKG